MYRSPTKLVGLAWIVIACGSPGDLDVSQYPAPGQTGYADDPSLGGAVGNAGASGSPLAGAGGSNGSGSGGSGAGGSGAGGSGGSGAAGGGVAAGGSASGSGGGSGSAGQGGSGAAPSGSCPDDISVLLNRPGPSGGCQGQGCHVPNGQRPDLTSPGVAERLLNVASSCNGRPYISATDSFIENKLVGSPPECGYQMPFLSVSALSAADRQCILDWVDEVAAGM